MIWKAVLIFTITTCILTYPHATTTDEQIIIIAIGSLTAAALMDSRGKAEK